MRRLLLFFAGAAIAVAQVATVPNTDFPTFRATLNASLLNAASITGSYSNPSWITALAYAKITGVPSFESPLTFSSPLVRTTNAITCPTCALNTTLTVSGTGTFGGIVTAAGFASPPGTVLALTGAHVAAASVATPAANHNTIFFDSSNADLVSRKDSSGAVTVVEGGGGGGGGGAPGGAVGTAQFKGGASTFSGQGFIFSGGAILTESQRAIDQGYVVLTQGGNLTLSGTADQNVSLATGVSCNTRFTRVLISVTTQFTGGTGGLWLKLQHGSADLTPLFSLTQSGSDLNFYSDIPNIGCMGASTATVQAVFVGNGSENHNLFTAGAVTIEVAGYAAR